MVKQKWLVVAVILLAICVVGLGGYTIYNKNNCACSKESVKEEEREVVEQRFVYVKINPLAKIVYEERYKLCGNSVCSNVETKVVDMILLNADAERIYSNLNINGLSLNEGIEKLVSVAKENNINTDEVSLYYDSNNFKQDGLNAPGSNIVVEKVTDISEAKIEELKNEPNYFTVSLDYNDGEESTSPKNVIKSVEENKTIGSIETPTREGYTFVSWQLDGKDFDLTTPITCDITLIAKWEKSSSQSEVGNQLTITFDSDGGSEVASQTINYGTKVKEPKAPTKKGYVFIEWQLNGVTFHFNSNVVHDLTLKAKWEKEIDGYTVTFDSNGGSNIGKQIVEKNKPVSKPSNPTKEGYTFKEWQLNGKTYNFSSNVTGNITLKAVWEANKYTVTFDSNGGSSVSNQTISYNQKVAKPSNPTKKGYNFVEWQLNGKAYNFNSLVTNNITLKAVWKAKVYTIGITLVDQYSPDRILKVYEDGTQITFKAIQFTDGTEICKGTNPTVSASDIEGETSFKVVLNDNTVVTASVK